MQFNTKIHIQSVPFSRADKVDAQCSDELLNTECSLSRRSMWAVLLLSHLKFHVTTLPNRRREFKGKVSRNLFAQPCTIQTRWYQFYLSILCWRPLIEKRRLRIRIKSLRDYYHCSNELYFILWRYPDHVLAFTAINIIIFRVSSVPLWKFHNSILTDLMCLL
jgi:hypothetical protein